MNRIVTGFIFFIIIMACSDNGSNQGGNTGGDHVWKEQTDTMDKAKQVENQIMDSAELTRQSIEVQSQ